MAFSFIVPSGDFMGSEELNKLRKLSKKFERKDIAFETLTAR
jgi:hypothetical protein